MLVASKFKAMLHYGPKTSALLLIGALILATSMVVPAMAAPIPSAPGCHGHSLPAQNPQPTNFQCCISGHSPALQPDVSQAIVFIPVGAAITASLTIPVSIQPKTFFSENVTSPPLLTPLRI